MDYGIISSSIRSHMEENSTEERRSGQQVNVLKFPTFDDSNSFRMSQRDSRSELELEQEQEQEQEQEHPGNYVLRENPKKTKKFVDSKELKVCKECGKGFQSLKALCGHMASHSDKERASNKLKPEKKRLVTMANTHSDTESSGPRPRRASRRIKYKNLGGYGIEKEQQEVAISLMLLSRDSSYKGCQNSVAESSSNDSVVLEATEMIISAKKGPKLKSDAKTCVSEDSDSGYFRNGPKKINSDVSVDGFLTKSEFYRFKHPGLESGSGFDAKLGKSLVHDDDDEEEEEEENRDSSKYELRKRTRTGIYKAEEEVEELSSRYNNAAQKRRSKYECLTCNKTFGSHTALGGHRASHAKLNNGSFESAENSIETEVNAERKSGPPKKSKGHECPICFRMFKSGQALGGHKRSHFIGGREANSITTLVRQEPTPEPEIAVLFDLNLPAPMEEGDHGFMEW